MTATRTKTRASRSRSRATDAKPTAPALPPTLGPVVCRFMEKYLVHGPGDVMGQPFKLTGMMRAIVYTAYELQPNGDRMWQHVLAGLPKGNAKTEVAAAFAITEAVGPVVFGGWKAPGRPIGVERTSPEIPVAAASFDQADNVFACAGEMIKGGPLAGFFEVYDTEILIRDRPGKIERVAAVAGSNDGGKPTFSVHDELHEWTGNKERVHLVLLNNLRKRKNTWALDISTAADNEEGLLGHLHQRGLRIERGDEAANGFRMIWIQAPKELDLEKPDELEQAIRLANPAVGDGYLSLDGLVSRYHTLAAEGKTHEFRRYNLNQFTSSPTEWLPDGVWAKRAEASRTVAEQEPVTLAIDGDWTGRRIGIVGCTIARPRHLFVAQLWEKGEADPISWTPPKLDVLVQALKDSCAKYQVQEIAINPTRFPELFNELEGVLPVVSWPSHNTARMAPAVKQLRDSICVNLDISHDGSPAFQRHVNGAQVTTDTHERQWIGKAPLAVAAVMANDLAIRTPAPKTSVYEIRGVRRL